MASGRAGRLSERLKDLRRKADFRWDDAGLGRTPRGEGHC